MVQWQCPGCGGRVTTTQTQPVIQCPWCLASMQKIGIVRDPPLMAALRPRRVEEKVSA